MEINGKKLTFAEIADLPREQKWPILEKLGEMDKLWAYQIWWNDLNEAADQKLAEADARLQIAKQREKDADARLQIAKQREKDADAKLQSALQLGKELDKQLISKYEQYITNVERWSSGEREIVEQIARADITPTELRARAYALLNNKDMKGNKYPLK